MAAVTAANCTSDAGTLDWERDGARLFHGAALAELPWLIDLISGLPEARAGVRIHGLVGLNRLISPSGAVGAIAGSLLNGSPRAVRAILFDKTPATNWSLGWHQDRTICVAARIDTPGFGPWTVKADLTHVAPPFALLARMVTLRVHLDDVTADNAPLLIAPGSHRLGRIAEAEVAAMVEACGTACCLAGAGDVWAYSTPILHASAAATAARHRRVLQVDFSCDELPGPLEWLGV